MDAATSYFQELKAKSVNEYLRHFKITVTYLRDGAEIDIICSHCGHKYANINVASDRTVKMIVTKSRNHLYNKHKIWTVHVSSYLIDQYIRYDLLH